MYAIVSAVEIAMDAPLKAFTLSRIFCASDLSSISRRPVPSTSQTPACAMFHKPVASDPLNPRPRKRGTAIMALWAGGAPVASCTAARSAHAVIRLEIRISGLKDGIAAAAAADRVRGVFSQRVRRCRAGSGA